MKDGKERVWDMRKGSFQYALRAIKLYQALQERKDGTGWILGNQSLPLRSAPPKKRFHPAARLG